MYAARKSGEVLLASCLYEEGLGKVEHTGDTPVRVMLANKDIKSVEDDDHSEVEEGEPRSVWLEVRPEHESVTVNSLSLERLMKLDVGNADRAPCEEGSDGGQVLEPAEDDGWTA